MTVRSEVDEMIAGLGELTPHGRALAEAARLLADDVDSPPRTVTGPRAITGYVSGLRATLDELQSLAGVAKPVGRTSRDDLAERRQNRTAEAATVAVAGKGGRKRGG